MKKKKRIIKWIALGVVLTGIVALVVVAGMYSYHHAQTEDIISNFKHTVEQLQEDNGEQEDRSDGKQTGQEAEKQDDNSILNDNNPGNKDWSEGDSYSRLGSAEKALRQQKATIYQISSIIHPQDMV